MNRTKSTHVRKFGGVWYQLVGTDKDSCEGCFFYEEYPDEDEVCFVFSGSECNREYYGGLFKNGSIWKEIGKI